jgi:hypothetical protein
MTENKPVADRIHAKLEALGLSGPGAVLLDGLAPLAPLGAQLAYILQPMLGRNLAGGLTDVAGWLEQPDDVREVAQRLRKERP